MDNEAAVNLSITHNRASATRWRPWYSSLAVCALMVGAGSAQAGPEGGQVVAGHGSINRAGGNTTVINQQSHRLGINWSSFNVGANEQVVFDQPSASSIALNRILDHNPSQILGAIDANGRVFLINPSGIIFGESARVNLQSLVASSLDISVADFMRGDYDLKNLSGREGGLIVNRGLIQAATGGSVTLVGGAVSNEGLIVADFGEVNLAAGRAATLDFDGDGLMLFQVDSEVLENAGSLGAAVSNTGTITANGGQVLLSGSAARDVFGSVVNNQGVIRANRIENVGGEVRLMAGSGTVLNSGDIDVSGNREGGNVQLLGNRVGVYGAANIDASGQTGGGTVLVGGGFQGSDPDVLNAQATFVGVDSEINADAIDNGDGGTIIVWSDETTRTYGHLSARGGANAGDGGLVETSSKGFLDVRRTPDLSAANGNGGEWLIDPRDIDIVSGPGCNNFTGGCPTPDAPDFTPSGNNSELGVDFIEAALMSSANVTITTDNGGTDAGDIMWEGSADLDFDGAMANANLTLTANGFITILGDITDSSGTDDSINLFLNAGGKVTIDSVINLNNGTFNVGTVGTPIGGDFELDANGNNGQIFGSAVNVFADGNLLLEGDIDLSGATGATSVNINGGLGGVGPYTHAIDFDSFMGVDTANINGGGASDTFNIMTDYSGNLNGAAGNDAFFFLGGTVGGNIDGGAGNDDLTAANSATITNIWSIFDPVAAPNNTVTNLGGTFSNITNAIGGSGVDEFTIRFSRGNIFGGGGDDTFTVSGGTAGTILDGGADEDTLIGRSFDPGMPTDPANNTWTLNAAQGGIVDGVPNGFTTIENVAGGGESINTFNITAAWGGDVTGSNGVDTFNINPGGSVVGNLAGGMGNDIFNFGSDVALTAMTISGDDGDDDFNFNTNSVDTIVSGGDGNDDFNFNGGAATMNLNGEAGNDNYVLMDGEVVAGTIDGGADTDTLSWLAYTTTRTLTLTGAGGTDGFDGEETAGVGSVTAFENMNAFISSGNADTLIAPNTPNTWIVTGDDTFTLNDPANVFTDYASLTGGTNTDDFTLLDGATISGAINGGGGGGNNSLTGGNGANTWTLNTVDGGMVGGVAGGFSDIDDTIGGTSTDTFNITAAWAGDVRGEAATSLTGGIDTFNINPGGSVDGNLAGGMGNDIFNFGSDVALTAMTISGDDGDDDFNFNTNSVDTIVSGGNGSDDFNFNGGAATLNLNGEAGDDNYVLMDGAVVAGTIDGGADTDTLSWLAYITARTLTLTGAGGTDGFNGNETIGSVTAFQNMNAFVSSGNADTLVAPNIANTWTVTGDDTFTLNDPANVFTDYANLTGNNNTDDFILLDGATISGAINGGGGNNSLTAGNGANTWALSATNGGTVGGVTGGFTNIDDAIGGTSTDTFNITAVWAGDVRGEATTSLTGGIDTFNINPLGNVAGNLSGGMGNDIFNFDGGIAAVYAPASISGDAGNDDFNFNTGTVNTMVSGGDGNDDFNFNGAAVTQAINGNANNDTFVLADGAVVTGTINGGTGTDTLNWLAYTTSRTLALTGQAADGFNGSESNGSVTLFNDVNSFVSSGNADTLMAPNTDNTWLVTGDDTFSLNGAANVFTNYANLTGGILMDDFTLLDGSTISGAINGGGGGGINSLTGGGGINTWALNAMRGGTVNGVDLGFTNIDNVTGGASTDNFTISAAWGSNVNGANGTDTFTLSGVGTVGGAINGGTGTNTLIAANGLNTWTVTGPGVGSVTGVTGGFSNITNLTGGTSTDNFTLMGGSLGGAINGGGGAGLNSLTAGSGGPNTWTLNAADGGSVTNVTGGFADIDNAIGGTTADTFNITAWNGMLSGGQGDDIFNFNTAGAFAPATISGGAGNDDFNFNSGSVNTAVSGGANSDDFNFNGGAATQAINGEAGNDNYVLADGAVVAGTLDGGADSDTLNWMAYTTARTLTLTGAGGTDGFNGNEAIGSVTLFNNIDTFVGSGLGDTLVALNTPNTWLVTGNDAVTINGPANVFTGYANLTGGTSTDDFTLLAGATISGAINGGDGAGVNSLTAGNGTNFWTLNFPDGGTVSNLTGGFTDIDNVTGGAMIDAFTISALWGGNVSGGGGNQQDGFTLSGAGGVSGILNGDGGFDTLFAGNVPNTWILNAADGGSLVGLVNAFVSIENAVGGMAADTFNITAWSGQLSGGLGDDIFNFNTAGAFAPATIIGDAGNDDFNFNSGSVNTVVSGGADSDDFNFNGGAVTQSINGEAGNDNYVLADGAVVAGTIDGGADIDTLNWMAYTSPRTLTLTGGTGATGFSGNETAGSVTLFNNMDAFISSGTGDTLVAQDTDNTWVVTGADIFTLNTVLFTNYANLTGGMLMDDFTLMGGTISGAINGGGGAGVNSLTAGSGGPNTWTLNAADGGSVTNVTGGFTDIDNVTGGTAADTFNITAWNGMLSGGAGDDIFNFNTAGAFAPATISGGAGNDDFNFNSGSVNTVVSGGADSDDFNFNGGAVTQSINGEAGNDNYVLADASVVAGTIDGGADIDTLNWMAYTTPRTLRLTGGTGATGFSGIETAGSVTLFNNMDAFISSGTGDTLVAQNTDNTWLVTGADIFTLNTVQFTNYANLTGGTLIDNFTLMGGTVSGAINGGGGSGVNSLTAADGANTWTLNAANSGTVSNVTGGFADIDNVIGGAMGDNFTISAAWAQNVSGGDGGDTFAFADGGSVGGILSGGLGMDTADYSAVTAPANILLGTNTLVAIENFTGNNGTLTGGNAGNAWMLTGAGDGNVASGTETVNFTGFGGVSAGTAGDAFTVASGASFAGTVTGAGGNDTVVFEDGSSITGVIDGGAGTDTLDWMLYLTARTLMLSDINGDAGTESTSATGGFDNIETFITTGLGDTLVGANLANTWTVNGADAFNLNGTDYTGFANLTGNAGVDNFVLAAGGSLSGNLNGAAGNDIFTVGPGLGISLAGTIMGGVGDDMLNVTYTGADARTLTFDGGDGTDTLVTSGESAGAVFNATYDAAAGTLAFTGDNTQTLTSSNVESIRDTTTATLLTVNGSAGDDTITLGTGTVMGSNAMSIGLTGVTLDTANKTDVTVAGGGGADTIDIASDVSVAGTLSLDTETLTTSGGKITATMLRVLNAAMVGVGNTIRTAVDILQIEGGSGEAAFQDEGGVVLAASNTTGNLSVHANNAITQSGALIVGGDASFNGPGTPLAFQGAVNLTNAGNNIGGAVSLGGSSAAFTNQSALTLGASSVTGNLTATSLNGGITANQALTVGGTTTLAAAAGQNILVNNAANSFTGAVTVAGANNATLNAAGNLLLGAANVTGNYNASSAGNLSVQNALNAGGNVSLTSGGTVTETGSGAVNASALTATANGGITLQGANTVSSFNATNSGGNIALANTATTLAVTGVNQTGSGTVALNHTGAMNLTGAMNSGTGAVTLDATQAINQNSNITTSGGAVTVKGGNGIIMAANASTATSGGAIGYCAASGDVRLALLNAGAGNILVKTKGGNIVSINGALATNLAGTNVVLDASGAIGSQAQAISINAPPGNAGLITYLNTSGSQVFVANQNNTKENNETTASVVDLGAAAALAGFTAGQSASLQDVGFVDLALFSPDITLINTVGVGMKMPCGQLEEEDPDC